MSPRIFIAESILACQRAAEAMWRETWQMDAAMRASMLARRLRKTIRAK